MIASTRGALVLSLFEQFYDRVYWFARRSVDAPTAEDVAQEVFTRLLRIPDLEDRIVNSGYLIKVADNLIKRRHKQKVQLERFTNERTERPEAVAFRETPDDTHCAGAMNQLSDAEQDALRLIICEGLSYEAAAKALDVKVSTVNNWKFRGIQKLRLVHDSQVASIAS
jgi:RNA polymerase sigma factor (sigma-70 family)